MRHLAVLLLSFLALGLPHAWAQEGLLINGSRTITGTVNAATTTGTGTAYLMALDPPIVEYRINQCFTFKAHVANTGAATLNVNGVAIKTLKKYVGTVQSDLVPGDISLGQIVLTCYDGTVMQMVGAGFGSTSGTLGYTAENVVNKSATTALGTSNTLYPTQGAVKTYVDTELAGKQAALGFTAENLANKSTSAALGTSTTLYPTQSAVKSYVDTGLAAKQAALGFTPEDFLNKSVTTTLGTSNILYPTQGAVKAYVDAGLALKQDVGSGGLAYTAENEANKASSALLGTSNTLYPSQGAVKSYVDTGLAAKQASLGFTAENVANKATSTALGTSSTLYPSQGAVKTYVDDAIATRQPVPTPGDARLASDFGVVCDGVTMTSTEIQTALDTVPVGTRLILPGGDCRLNAALTMTRSIHLQGAGMDHTYLKQTVTTLPVLTVSSINTHVSGMTLMHTGNPVAGGDGLIVRAPDGGSLQAVTILDVSASWNWRGFVLGCMAYGQAAHVWAQKNNSHGFEFLYETTPGCGVDQWDILHAISQLNVGAGFYGNNTAYAFGLGPWITQSVTFANNLGGYVFQGSAGHPINDIRLASTVSSGDNVAGISLDTFGGSHVITEPWIELVGVLGGFALGTANTPNTASHTGHCLNITSNNGATTITGGVYWSCSWSGLALDAPYTTLTGGTSLGNGQALDGGLARRAGVHIGGNGVQLSGHSFLLPGTTTLFYIHLSGTLTDMAIGVNSYSPDLSPQNFVGNQASITAMRPPALVAGTSVHTNAPNAPGLQLYDATQGVNPLKLLRVTGGQLQILNAAGSAMIQGLSDAGTPSWPQRRGNVTIANAATTATVTLSPVEPDGIYFVQVTPVTSTGAPAAASFTVAGVAKGAGSFVLTVAGAPGAGTSVSYDWLVYR